MGNPRRLTANTNPPRIRRFQWIQRDAAERSVDQWVLLDRMQPTSWKILRFPLGDYRSNSAFRYALYRRKRLIGRYSHLLDAKGCGAEEYDKELPEECLEQSNA